MAVLNQDQRINLALITLRAYSPCVTRQQFKTLRGQILAGDPEGAMKGLQNILKRRQDREHPTRQDPGHRAGQ